MNIQDQWFQPGDKVMRVSRIRRDGVYALRPGTGPDYGEILCVRNCKTGLRFNHVFFVGYPKTPPADHDYGYPAYNFRKVEEIKLCVEAAKHALKPKEIPVTEPA